MLQTLQKSNDELETVETEYRKEIKSNNLLLIFWGIVLCIVMGVLAIWSAKKINLKCRVGIGYFLIMPNEILLQNDVLDHIRKNKILESINYL